MNSEFYSTREIILDGNYHACALITATYTFDFGKKVKRDNEPQASGSASLGILK